MKGCNRCSHLIRKSRRKPRAVIGLKSLFLAHGGQHFGGDGLIVGGLPGYL